MRPDATGVRPGRTEWIYAAAVAMISLLFHLLYFRHGVQNLVDLGVACVDADRILDGQVPGRDFLDPYGPARFYITALAFSIGGKSLLTFSVVCLVLLTIKDVLVFFAARTLVSRPWALYVSALAIMVHGPLHKVFLTFAAMLVLLPALRLAGRPRMLTAFLLGLSVSAAGLFRYDVGAAGILVSILILTLIPFSRTSPAPGITRLAGGFTAGLALLGGPAALFYFHGVNLPAFIGHHLKRLHSLEQANAGSTGALDLPSSSAPEEFLFMGLFLFIALVVALVLVSAVRLWFKGKEYRERALSLAVLVLMGILLYNQVRLGMKFSRLSQISPPYYIALAFLLQALFRHAAIVARLRPMKWVCLPAAAAFFAFLAVYIWSFEGTHSQDSFAVLRMKEYYVDHPRVRCYFKRKKGREIEEIVRYIERVTAKGEPIFTGPSCPLFHFLADRPNPSPFTDFTFYYFDKENQRVMIDAIEKAGVNYAVNWPRELTGFVFVESAPVLTDYLNTQFMTDRRIGRFMIMKRRL